MLYLWPLALPSIVANGVHSPDTFVVIHCSEKSLNPKDSELFLDLAVKLIICLEIISDYVINPLAYCVLSLFNWPLREQYNQLCLPWSSHAISFYNLGKCMALILDYVLFHVPAKNIVCVCLLWRSFAGSSQQIESNHKTNSTINIASNVDTAR